MDLLKYVCRSVRSLRKQRRDLIDALHAAKPRKIVVQLRKDEDVILLDKLVERDCSILCLAKAENIDLKICEAHIQRATEKLAIHLGEGAGNLHVK